MTGVDTLEGPEASGASVHAAVSPELVDRLLYYASRAPSPHNAQGWRIEVEGLRFRVARDPEHQVLAAFDPYFHEGDLACGAAVLNLCVGAAAFGFDAKVTWRPAPDVAADVLLHPALSAAGEAAGARLRALSRRAVNRSHYQPDPVDEAFLERLRAAASRLGFTLAVATGASEIAQIAAVAARAGVMKLAHAPTQGELYDLTRFTPRAAGRARDGLDLELFFIPGLAARAGAVAMHPRVIDRLRLFGLPATVARDAEELPLRSAPALCLLHADSLDATTFLRGGACFEELALDVAETELALALHSAPIEVGLSHPDPPHHSVAAEWHAEIAAVRSELLGAFGVPADAVPIAMFRLGTPTRLPERRSLRRRPATARVETAHYREMTRRNQPSISLAEQRALREVRVLVAGCGSIGGAPVVPLVRLGLEQLVLTEPGEYELNNLNRQAAEMRDIGRNKAEVLADRARAINPQVEVLVEPRGVTSENVDWLVGTTDMVLDGVDVTERAGIEAKRALHDEAWRQRRLVVSGLDLGGTQLVYLFDYGDGVTRPLGGRFDGVPDGIDAMQFLSRLVGVLDVPRELLTYTEAVIRGEDGSAPQLAPTADQFGVLAAWAVLDFANGRRLRRRVKVAIPDLLMPPRRRIASEAARLVQLVRLKLVLEQAKRVRGGF